VLFRRVLDAASSIGGVVTMDEGMKEKTKELAELCDVAPAARDA
jgi:hypothetical protein